MTGTWMIAAGLAVLAGLAVSAAEWRCRRSADRRDGVFRCKIRLVGDQDGSRSRPRGRARAHWVDDVLVIDTGLLYRTTRVLPVRTVHGFLDPTVTGTKFERFVSLRLELDDGSTVEVAGALDSVDMLGGPFLTAHSTLPRSRR